jgi:3-phenylpropionate/trans-cinnamate dioxygenase ferredoxin reductase subunit
MTIVVVGAGLAGGTAVTELRDQGYDGRIVLLGAEQHLPYERPPLSKGYLLGKEPLAKAFVHDAAWYAEHDVEVRVSTDVKALDLEAKVVRTDAGEEPFDKLLLATGAEPRHLAMADESDAPVAYLRTIEHSDRLRASFGDRKDVLVVGAGWIGLEVAAAAREAGCKVTVVESAELPLLAVLGPEVAQVFADLHRAHGVDLRLSSSLTREDLAAAGLVVVGIGVAPRTVLAEEAGLDVDNGVLVDETLRSSHPDVWAVGDIANHQHPVLGRRVRVEHWDTAIQQAKVAARNLAGAEERYEKLPYFFTDQYSLGMEYVGHVGRDGYDRVVVRGESNDDDGGVFQAFWLKDGRVEAGMHVNDWDATDGIKGLVGREVDADRLADTDVPLTEV